MPASETRVSVAVTIAVGLLLLSSVGGGIASSSGHSIVPAVSNGAHQHASDGLSENRRIAASSNAIAEENTTRLSGTVTDEHGEPIYGAFATVNGSDQEAKTNADGFFRLELEPGSYEVTVSADRFASKTWAENLSADRWTRTDVSLAPAPTELEGTVTNETGAPVENAVVRLVGTGYVTSSDENGTYALEVEPGEYTLEAMADGYETERLEIDVEERRTTVADVQLAAPVEEVQDEEDEEGDDSSEIEHGDDSQDGDGASSDDSSEPDEPDGADDVGDRIHPTERPPHRTQLFTLLFLGGTFVATMAVVASVGLYRNWTREA